MKFRLLTAGLAFIGHFATLFAQDWTEPQVPGENLNETASSKIVYFYNVEADAFVINGMDWNTNACATRLADGDMKVSTTQQCFAYTGNGKVRIKMKNYSDWFISCPDLNANNVYVDQNNGYYFTYSETHEGSRVYTLNNDTHKKDLDLSWSYGGHLTLTNGVGHTTWAFISEENITNGAYMVYKAKKQLYALYKALADAGKAEIYAAPLATAYDVYSSESATLTNVIEAARKLFNATYADITGPVDVSFLFDDADMAGAGTAAAWTNGTSTFGWGEFENFHSAFMLNQSQTVPQGKYDVMLHAFYREDGSGNAPILTVKGKTTVTSTVPSVKDIPFDITNANNNNWVAGGLTFIPDGLQSAGQAITHGDATTTAEGCVVGADGLLTITTEVKSAEQWFNWNQFRIIYKGLGDASIKESLATVIDEAETLYGDGTGKGKEELKTEIDKAKSVYDDINASNSSLVLAESMLKEAITTYHWTSASIEKPVDISSHISNNSFEKGFDHWSQSNMAIQTNTAFTLKDGNTYIEKWTPAGGAVGDGSVTQDVQQLGVGVYILKAVAQNVQEGSTASQNNAWIVANNSKTEITGKEEYSLVFTNIEESITLGFVAEEASGNWISVDHFRLYYAGGELSDFKKELQKYIDDAKTYVAEKMQNTALNTLKECIASAEAEIQKETAEGYTAISTPLRNAIDNAKKSIKAYQQLAEAIADAETTYGDGEKNGAEKFLAAINKAKSVSENLDADLEELADEVKHLELAAFEYKIANPTGVAPKVVTDKRYVRGAIAAFGRMTVSGVSESDIIEQGFCWSTEPDPTILDHRTTKYLENNGRIYWMEMQPATVYYMRAYAMTKGYAVGYGDVIKMSTLPKGNVTYWYNNGGDAAHNDRINTALTIATTYWSNYTSIRGFNVSCTFSPGTPTADCGYGGGMRIGVNRGQRAGTCMHEMNHGIGGGTLEIWGGWSVSPLRESVNGYWAGDRANEAVRFWENNDNLVITGAYDGGHWGVINKGEAYSEDNIFHNKYPHNGAHLEPGAWAGPKNENDTEIFYIGNSLINQGFCEDGLIPVNFYSGAFCLPAYVFTQEDDRKYYIKNESDEHGLSTSYLIEKNNGLVKWVNMEGTDVTLNDSAAWYITFTPDNQYYQFRNAATGRYLTFTAYGTNGIKTVVKTLPSTNEDFHLMKGRKDIVMGNFTTRGYWVIHPEAKSNPATLTATSKGNVSANTLDLFDSATAQRWLFLQANDIELLELGLKQQALDELDEMIAHMRKLKETAHTEDISGADDELEEALTGIEIQAENVANANEVTSLIEQVRNAGMVFLGKVTPAKTTHPFDITFLVENAAIDHNNGWSDKPTFAYSCCEYYQSTFDFNQTIKGLPAGTYELRAKAFQRPGNYTAVYNSYVNGSDYVNTQLYAGSQSVKVCNIASGARRTNLHAEDVEVGSPKRYIPNSMVSAAAYLRLKTYENKVITSLSESNSNLKIGIRCTSSGDAYWTIFDDFRLYYYGSMTPGAITNIESIKEDSTLDITENTKSTGVYNLQGVKVSDTLEGLSHGIYIINRKKVLVK